MGFLETDDNELFGRLLMEINQAGLSWDTVLNKAESIKAAYADFDIATVAAFTEKDIERLLQNPGIIRMRRKLKRPFTTPISSWNCKKNRVLFVIG